MSQAARESAQGEELQAAGGLFRLLARLWLREVDGLLLDELSAAPLREVFERAGGSLVATRDAQSRENLAADYCQLFVGPTGHLPPIQSVWETGQFQGQPTLGMNSYISLTNYRFTRDSRAAMVDHLGVQLDLMAHLCEVCLHAENQDQRSTSLAVKAAYFDKHLAWPETLLERALQKAATPFYRGMLRLTRDVLASEQMHLAQAQTI